jgi:hypothetical protein
MTAPREGGCQCGAVRFSVTGYEGLVVCHCTECQRQAGSAFGMSLIVKRSDFRLLGGELKSFFRTAESGRRIEGHFCPGCGVRIFNSSAAAPEVIRIRAGTLDETSWLRPARQIWMRSRQPWLDSLAGVEAVEKQG